MFGGAPNGLVSCDACGKLAAPRGNYFSVHFAKQTDTKPCPRSWPSQKAVSK
jgi:hypothetical protein